MSLTINLVRGKTFAATERVDNTKLNQLGLPTAEVTGGVDTSQIEDEAVTADKTDFVTAGDPLRVFDIYQRRPIYNPQAYDGDDDREKIQNAIDAAILDGGGVILFDREYLLETPGNGQTFGGILHYLFAQTAEDCQLEFRGIRGARLIDLNGAASGTGIAILGVKGTFSEVIVEGLTFKRSQEERVGHHTFGVTLFENSQGLKRVRVGRNHFQNVACGVYGAASGLRVEDNEFSHPIGEPTTAGNISAVYTRLSLGVCEDVALINNRMMGLDGGSLGVGMVRPAYGFADVQAMGVTIQGNRVRRIAGIGLYVPSRAIGSANSWVDDPRKVAVTDNRVEFEEVTSWSETAARYGIYVGDTQATIAANQIRGCYRGILVHGGGAGYDSGNDLGTRINSFVIEGNEVELAADLQLVDTGDVNSNERFGIKATYCRRGKIAENLVQFKGRTSTGVTAKYWLCNAIGLTLVDDFKVGGNDIFGPVDTAATSADRVWLGGVNVEFSRRVEVAKNYLRALNIGVGTSSDSLEAIPSSAVEIEGQRMEDVVWPYAGLGRTANDGTNTPGNLHKRFKGTGYKGRVMRTTFDADATGYYRVGSFTKQVLGRLKIWSVLNPTPAIIDVAFYNNGASPAAGCLVQTAYITIGSAVVSKVRICTGTTPSDQLCHIDINVALATTNAIFVEFEQSGGDLGAGGLWSEPLAYASMPTGYETRSATGEVEGTLVPGLAVYGGLYNEGRVTVGAIQIWDSGSVLRALRGTPAAAGDGSAL